MPHSKPKYIHPLSSDTSQTPEAIAEDIKNILESRHETLAAAESLTGGSLMAAISSVDGSSAVFRGGMVTYATPLKHKLLGVDPEIIVDHGVIYGEVAREMAEGARRATKVNDVETTWGIATTGVAGKGWQDDKKPGTVYIGVASEDGAESFGPFLFEPGREKVRKAAVKEALVRLREKLNQGGGSKVEGECLLVVCSSEI